MRSISWARKGRPTAFDSPKVKYTDRPTRYPTKGYEFPIVMLQFRLDYDEWLRIVLCAIIYTCFHTRIRFDNNSLTRIHERRFAKAIIASFRQNRCGIDLWLADELYFYLHDICQFTKLA
ncbi:hypothetical protein CDAR_472621 [Caerostris darwini]|uniref:Uncharacterized protein n=1 Tax=Caerostris darwini TaxID=1538125 RepID=A0AAV4SJK7_9ARAC|nr:hypothetical protein CDAR_472621 [Caerostris darwini]